MTTAPTAAQTPAEPAGVDPFAQRLFAAGVAALEVLNVELGARLGLHEVLASHGPLTSEQLAARGGINERFAREWLEQQATAGVEQVEQMPAGVDDGPFSLPAAHSAVPLDHDSEAYMGAFCAFVPLCATMFDTVGEAYRTGSGVPNAGNGIDDIHAAWTRPIFLHHLTQT